MRQQLDVDALRLSDVEEGQVLTIWVAVPVMILEDDDDSDSDEEEDEDDSFYLE